MGKWADSLRAAPRVMAKHELQMPNGFFPGCIHTILENVQVKNKLSSKLTARS